MLTKQNLEKYFKSFLSLPWTADSIPGNIVEKIIALTYQAEVLNTYDFVDVVDQINLRRGWQVKSTKESTPITWKRAKIPNKENLIRNSIDSDEGLQVLGDTIISFCNNHVEESCTLYDLDEIYYSRCILFKDRSVKYFERLLATSDDPRIFIPENFFWKWSSPKNVKKKEQLSALHGFRKSDGKKMWAWHGHGENQLHFSGESDWWDDGKNSIELTFLPPERISYAKFFNMISNETK
jgi:hypothetical protein